jgi:hypothetical protein
LPEEHVFRAVDAQRFIHHFCESKHISSSFMDVWLRGLVRAGVTQDVK